MAERVSSAELYPVVIKMLSEFPESFQNWVNKYNCTCLEWAHVVIYKDHSW